MLVTFTCDPPNWAAMLPQKFSAATTRIVVDAPATAPAPAGPADVPEGAVPQLVNPRVAATAAEVTPRTLVCTLTPLHLAASACHTNVVALLLDKGAKIDCAAKDGATPLHLAAQEGCADVVNLLLAKGANVNARDDQKRTPLVRAEQWHQDAMVPLLRQHGGSE